MKTEIYYHGNEQEKMEAARRDIAEYLGKEYFPFVKKLAESVRNPCMMTWETWQYPANMLGIEGYPASIFVWDMLEHIESSWS